MYRSVSDSPPVAGRYEVIDNFRGASGDRIDLTEIDANVLVAGNQAFTYVGGEALTGAGQLRLHQSTGLIQGSTDADAAAELEILVDFYGDAVTDILL